MLASALIAGGGSWVIASKPVWILFGFEVVVAAASIVGLLWLRSARPDAPGLGLACLGGAIAACTFLSWLTVRNVPIAVPRGSAMVLGWLGFRLAAGVVLAGVGALAVLGRDERSRGYLFRAVGCGAGLAVAAGIAVSGGVRRTVLDLPGWASFAIATFVFILCCVLLSAAVHCAVRAFECGMRRGGADVA